MLLTSRDLSLEVRVHLLQELQTKLGWTEYNRLVRLHGEDGLLDLVLAQMEQQARSSTPSRQPVDPSKVGLSPWCLFLFGCLLMGCARLHLYYHPRPPGGPEGIRWENFDWAWYWKVLLGVVGTMLDFLALARLAAMHANRSTRFVAPPVRLGCLWQVIEHLVYYWMVWFCVGVAFLAGGGGGPILLVWGIVDLLR